MRQYMFKQDIFRIIASMIRRVIVYILSNVMIVYIFVNEL